MPCTCSLPQFLAHAPTNIQASQVGEGQVQVTWTGPIDRYYQWIQIQPVTYSNLPSGTLSRTFTLGTGSHVISVVSLSTMNEHLELYSAKATDTVEIQGFVTVGYCWKSPPPWFACQSTLVTAALASSGSSHSAYVYMEASFIKKASLQMLNVLAQSLGAFLQIGIRVYRIYSGKFSWV